MVNYLLCEIVTGEIMCVANFFSEFFSNFPQIDLE